MYEIQVSTRRVTIYMVEQARAWLYRKIVSGEYQPNRCKAGKLLLLQIQTDHAVTAETYEQFISNFDHSPFHYLTSRAGASKSKLITTPVIENYFVSYNGYVLPIGFVKEFFEDDYETQSEIEALLAGFAKADNEETGLKWKSMMINLEDKIETLSGAYPGALRPHPLLLVTRLFYTAITVALLVAFFTFLSEVHFIDVLKQVVLDNKFNFDLPLTVNETMASYFINGDVFVEAGKRFMFSEYMETYASFFVVNLILFFILIGRVKKTLQFVFYLLHVIVDNLRIVLQKLFIRIFDKNGVNQMQAYYDKIIPDVVRDGSITEDMRKNLPGSKTILSMIQRFDIDKAMSSLSRRHVKYKAHKFAYDADKKKAAMATWKKGIVSSVLLLAVALAINMPDLYQIVMKPIIEYVNSMIASF